MDLETVLRNLTTPGIETGSREGRGTCQPPAEYLSTIPQEYLQSSLREAFNKELPRNPINYLNIFPILEVGGCVRTKVGGWTQLKGLKGFVSLIEASLSR